MSRNFEILNYDELFLIAIRLDFESLINFCRINTKTLKFSKKNVIWNYLLNRDFSEYQSDFKFLTVNTKYRLLYNLNYIKEYYKLPKNLTEIYNNDKLRLSYSQEDNNGRLICSFHYI